MPIKRNEIPDELKVLIPEEHIELVLIGKTCYELAPLTAGKAEIVIKELIDVIVRSFSELLKVAEQPEGKAKSMKDVVELTHALKKGLESVVAEGRIIRIIATALDLDEETVRKEATIKQLHHITGLLWKQNFDMNDTGAESRKNFDGLLVALSLKNRDDIVYQWADFALKMLINPQIGSLKERIVTVMEFAADVNMIDKAEVEKFIQSKDSMPTLPAMPDLPANTSTVNGGSSAASPIPAVEGVST